MSEEEQQAAREIAVEFVSTVVLDKWRHFGLPDSTLAECMIAQGAAMLAAGYPAMDVAERLRNLADTIEAGQPFGGA